MSSLACSFHSLLIFVLINCSVGFSQVDNPSDFHSPLAIPLAISANFGELRPNHFHMGVDFKTNGVEGIPLYAIENGFISRVKVSPYGYGKVIYIDHPNGITSVYAHCSKFKGALDSLVKKAQENEQNFEIEIYFTPTDIPVKKGELIALSGNSGSSTAPHLHFELRDTKTEIALNPLVYGFNISDHVAPEIKALKVYSVTAEGYQIPGKSKIAPVSKGKFGYYIGGDQLLIPADYCSEKGGVGFAFEVVDHVDNSQNACGLYASTLRTEKDTLFSQKFDKISFDESRFVNSHKDYQEYSKSKRKFHKSYKTQHNPLEIYKSGKSGIFILKPEDSLQITYAVTDPNANQSELKFKLKVAPGKLSSTVNLFPSWKYLFPDSTYAFQGENAFFSAQKHTFYEPTLRNLSLNGTITFGDPTAPIQNPITVKLKLPVKSIVQTSKYFIRVVTAGGKKHSLVTNLEQNWAVAESKFLGTFQLVVDTISPVVKPLNFTGTEALILRNRLTWKVSENETEIKEYDVFIDGKWELLEYETKGNYLIFNPPIQLSGKHSFQLVVKDSCGNTTIWSKDLIFP
jgi:hypothetical protein